MALTNEFMEAVSENKKTRVRIMLKDIMIVDPGLKSFGEMLRYAENNMPDLYDPHDGEQYMEDPAAWTEDDMNRQMVAVVTNFSRERVDLLQKMVRKLYGTEDARSRGPQTHVLESGERQPEKGLSGTQILGVVLMAAGGMALAGSIGMSSMPLALSSCALLVAGVDVLIVAGKKKRG